MATIVQNYGPIYGEVVNGTVQGRPNGSIYVPVSNTIQLDISDSMKYIIRQSSQTFSAHTCNSSGTRRNFKVVAQSQDVANYIRLDISEQSDFSTIVATRRLNAGIFNYSGTWFAAPVDPDDDFIVDGNTYYLRAVLVASTNVDVAVSDIITVTGVQTA